MKKELTEALAQKVGKALKDKYDLSSVILMTNSKENPNEILGYINGNHILVLKSITTTLHNLLEIHDLKSLSPEEANFEPALWEKIKELSAYLHLLYEARECIFNNDEARA